MKEYDKLFEYITKYLNPGLNNDDKKAIKLLVEEINIKKSNKYIQERKEIFIDKVNKYAFGMVGLNDFIDYWTEHGEKDRKMRFEKEKSFDILRRLKTWQRNSTKFNKQQTTSTKNVNEKWL